MKLDPTDIRYVSADAYRVLSAVEQGSKNHELVPVSLIAQLSASRTGGVHKSLGELAKRKLVGRVQNAKYDGYRLTYGGYDFLACRSFAKRDTVASIGNQIGTGKESDIYVVADQEGSQMVMKIHRLGRISFRAIKSKRDYLRKGQSASWMYMSRLAAIKEYAFMKVLYDHDFPVPKPIDQSRHCLIMELIDAFPLRQIAHVPDPGALYSALMDLIVRLAASGLIHGDFNEFNILIKDNRTDLEKDRDEENEEERDERIIREGGDFELEEAKRFTGDAVLEPILIDFPQMVSIDHADAEYYFNRDVQCIRTFFARRFKYESTLYPKFSSIVKDGAREFDLDVEVAASGFTKSDKKLLEDYMEEVGAMGGDNDDTDNDGDDSDDVDDLSDQNEYDAASDPSGNLADSISKTDLSDKLSSADEDNSNLDQTTNNIEDSHLEQDEETAQKAPRTKLVKKHKPDVESIVSSKLARAQQSAEKKHHGKKPATANVLGRAKGSKRKTDHRAAIKDSAQSGW